MAEFTDADKLDLMLHIRAVLPDAEFAPEESFGLAQDVRFEDKCGCYSEYTTEPCSFNVYVKATLPTNKKERENLVAVAEKRIERWAHVALEWSGCQCCGNSLSVWARVFSKQAATE